jgi:hypothetical protein
VTQASTPASEMDHLDQLGAKALLHQQKGKAIIEHFSMSYPERDSSIDACLE